MPKLNKSQWVMWKGIDAHPHSCVRCVHYKGNVRYCKINRMWKTKKANYIEMTEMDCEYWENKDEEE